MPETFRHRMEKPKNRRLLKASAITLAVVSSLILAREFWRLFVVVMLAIGIGFMIRDNMRELRGG